MFRRFGIITIFLFCLGTTYGKSLSENAQISLITCAPGEELYERYGHTAIHVCDSDNNLDVVFNYGIFSFETEHFYWKFVKGETYYQLGVEDTRYFMWAYAYEGRAVYEQVLNLTHEQKQQLYDALQTNLRPENCYYLYNFVFDNCATRPYFLIKKVLGDSLLSQYEGWEGHSYRDFIRHYTGVYSWADFGINLVFGKRANNPLHGEERLFLPEELMFYLSQATLPDGTRVIQDEHIQPFRFRHTPWYATCWFGLALFAFSMVIITLIDCKRHKLSKWIDLLLGVIYVVLLILVVFLTFFSLHPLVGFTWRLLIIPGIHLCTRLIYFIH